MVTIDFQDLSLKTQSGHPLMKPADHGRGEIDSDCSDFRMNPFQIKSGSRSG